MPEFHELDSDKLIRKCDSNTLGFSTTDEIHEELTIFG
jgi:hypothetical protein